MSLFVLALMQVAATPLAAPSAPVAPAYQVAELPDGSFALLVATLPATSLDAVQAELDSAAAKRCGAVEAVAGEQGYDQATDANGNAAPEITSLRLTYKCAAPATAPSH